MRNEGVAKIAKQLDCSKAYVSMVTSGKKKPSERMAAILKKVNSPVHMERGGVPSNPLMGTPSVHGGFDTHSLPPTDRVSQELANSFFESLGDELSPHTP